MLCSTTQWDGHGVMSKMVDAIGQLCHKSPKTMYEIQMAREELQIIWVKIPTPSTKRIQKYSKKC
jgi:hypothetical protein